MNKPKIVVTTAWSVETWGDSIESRGGKENSFHIQKVEMIHDNFTATAIANDGVIESVECNDAFVVGTQFHPEELLWGDIRAELVFKKFIDECERKVSDD